MTPFSSRRRVQGDGPSSPSVQGGGNSPPFSSRRWPFIPSVQGDGHSSLQFKEMAIHPLQYEMAIQPLQFKEMALQLKEIALHPLQLKEMAIHPLQLKEMALHPLQLKEVAILLGLARVTRTNIRNFNNSIALTSKVRPTNTHEIRE